jgi:hypothetical protein
MKKLLMTGVMGLFIVTTSAAAGSVVCSGIVETLAYHADNKLMVKLTSMNVPVFFCSPDSEWTVSGTTYKTGPQTCQTLYSTFLAAKMASKPIKNMWFDGSQVPSSCNGWSSWQSANIRNFLVE